MQVYPKLHVNPTGKEQAPRSRAEPGLSLEAADLHGYTKIRQGLSGDDRV